MSTGSVMADVLRMLRSVRRRCWQAQSRRQIFCGVLVISLSLTLSACVVHTPPNSFLCSNAGDASRATPPFPVDVKALLTVDGVVYAGYTFVPPGGGYPGLYAIVALRASDGTMLWHEALGGGTAYTTPLAVADGVLIVGGSGLVGLRASDGAVLWHATLGAFAVTASGDVLYAFSDNANATNAAIAALRLTDGRLLWRTPIQAPTLPSSPHGSFLDAPLVEGNVVYLAVGNGAVEAMRADTGAVLWTVSPHPTQSQQSQRMWDIPFAVAAGQVYVATNGALGGEPAGVLRLNPATGASDGYALRLPEGTLATYPLLLAGGVYVVLTAPQITAYRLFASGAPLLWRASTPAGMAVSAGSLLFAADPQTLSLVGSTYERTTYGTTEHDMIAAFRVSDGALLWSQRTLAKRTPGIAATVGHVVEAAPGVTNPCSDPPVDQAAQVRALRSADGGVAWTRALTAP